MRSVPRELGPLLRPARPHGIEGLASRGEHLVGVKAQAPALVGEAHSVRHAVEESDAKLALKLLHLHGDRGLGVAELLGRLREAAALDDPEEGLERSDLHGRTFRLRDGMPPPCAL